jgi:hypothetical protein
MEEEEQLDWVHAPWYGSAALATSLSLVRRDNKEKTEIRTVAPSKLNTIADAKTKTEIRTVVAAHMWQPNTEPP